MKHRISVRGCGYDSDGVDRMDGLLYCWHVYRGDTFTGFCTRDWIDAMEHAYELATGVTA